MNWWTRKQTGGGGRDGGKEGERERKRSAQFWLSRWSGAARRQWCAAGVASAAVAVAASASTFQAIPIDSLGDWRSVSAAAGHIVSDDVPSLVKAVWKYTNAGTQNWSDALLDTSHFCTFVSLNGSITSGYWRTSTFSNLLGVTKKTEDFQFYYYKLLFIILILLLNVFNIHTYIHAYSYMHYIVIIFYETKVFKFL